MKIRFGLLLAGLALVVACGSSQLAPLSDETPSPDGSTTPAFPSFLRRDWQTNFDKASVSPNELTQGQTKDGIPSIDRPKFLTTAEADFLADQEPVIAFERDGDARAYPIQILIWHEIVNDVVGGHPVIVTFCPLCNSAITFDRVVDGHTLDFGVSGFLRNSDLVMFDRTTESWWQQVTGEAIVGDFTGTQLELLPSTIVSWADFKAAFPDGRVLSRQTGFSRPYGLNPYQGYDNINSSPFLFDGDADGRLAAVERVVAVELEGETVAYPFSRLETQSVVADRVGSTEIVVFFKAGTTSALDRSSIAGSRDVGSAAVFLPTIDGQKLSFRADGDAFVDNETGSRWDILGRAVAGPLKGSSLEPVVSGSHFWFAWAAFKPETRVWQPALSTS